MSDFYNKYPYTDFHELNLDWVIERVKKLTEDWLATHEEWVGVQQDWADTEQAWIDFKAYVENYLNNLDVQDEIDHKINEMILDGSFETIIRPAVIAQTINTTTEWLSDHITQPTTPAIDTSLLISGAAAEAKETGARADVATLNRINALYINKLRSTSSGVMQNYNSWIVSGTIPLRADMRFELINASNDYRLKHAILFDKGMTFLGHININALSANSNTFLNGYSTAEYISFNLDSTSFTSEIPAGMTDTWYINVTDLKLKALTDQCDINRFMTGSTLTSVNVPTMTSQIGYYDTTGAYNAFSNIYASSINVTPGDAYLYSGYAYYGIASVVFLDSGDNFISAIQFEYSTNYISNKSFIVPEGAVKMLLQSILGYQNSVVLFSMTQGAAITDNSVTHDSYNMNSMLNTVLNDTYIRVNLNFENVTGYYDQGTGIYYEYANITAASVDVLPGQKFKLTGNAFHGMAMYVFFGYNNNIIASVTPGQNQNKYEDIEITVPNGAGRMLLQRHNDTITILKQATGKTVNTALNGKNITIIGDSITEYNFRAKTNWGMYIADWTDAKVQNLGRSGTGFAANYPYIDRISSIQSTPDIIGVAISFNDLFAGLPIGTATDTGTSSVAGYASDFFDALITAYPTTPIICYCQGPWASARPGNTAADSYVSVIKEICINKGIPYYDDLYYGCVLKPWINDNKTYYYTTDNDDTGNTGQVDGTHPNSEGHKAIARYLYPKFIENLVTTGLNYN